MSVHINVRLTKSPGITKRSKFGRYDSNFLLSSNKKINVLACIFCEEEERFPSPKQPGCRVRMIAYAGTVCSLIGLQRLFTSKVSFRRLQSDNVGSADATLPLMWWEIDDGLVFAECSLFVVLTVRQWHCLRRSALFLSRYLLDGDLGF
jgi:hypothetical protein